MTESEELEQREQVMRGRAAQAALDFSHDFLIQKRALIISEIESGENYMYENLMAQKVYLIVLRDFENMLKSNIQLGEIAEEELKNNG